MKLDRDVMALMRATKKAAKPLKESLERSRRRDGEHNQARDPMEQRRDVVAADA